MDSAGPVSRGSRLMLAAAFSLLALAAVAALAAVLRGESLANALDDLPVLLLAAGTVAGLLAWRETRREEEAAERELARLRDELGGQLRRREHELTEARGELAEARDELAATRGELEQAREEVRERGEELERERSHGTRVQGAYDLERAWNKHLRQRLAELREERGPLGDTSDVHSLVLRAALTLLEAEKGLVLSRADENADGLLDVACWHGFEHDPSASAVAQHFAERVLAEDETVRADSPEELELDRRSPADEEIDNLIGIPIYIHDRFDGVVVCANKQGGFHEYDDDVLLALGDHAGSVLENERLRGQVRSAFLATVRVLADAADAKDELLGGHGHQVSAYVASVAERLGVEARRREDLLFASLLHDVGKIGISERILLKPAELTEEERRIVELHPRIGYRLLQQVPALQTIAPVVLHHHERWDGNGYPSRLRGDDIPLDARLICVADAFSAMTTERPYRPAMSIDEACDELRRCAGTQFDPEIVRHFTEELRRRPPEPQRVPALATALSDPELAVRRAEEVPVLGFGAFSAVDNLTLLYGHRYLHDVAHAEAQRAAVQGRPFAVVVVELDDLTRINRERGYAAGDRALREVAEAALRVAGRCGGTAARLSGRRMCVLVPGADERIAERLADEIGAELGDGHNIRTRVAAWRAGESGDDVIERARGRRMAVAT